MHILLSAMTDFKGFPFGGTEALVSDLLGAIELGKDSRVTLAGLRSTNAAEPDSEVLAFGRNEFRFLSLCSIPQPARLPIRLSMAAGILRNARTLRAMKPDVIYAHSPDVAAACSLVFRGTPLVLHCHGIDNPLVRSRFASARGRIVPAVYDMLIVRPALGASKRVFVNADTVQFDEYLKQYGRFFGGPVVRIPPVVDRAVFRPGDRVLERERLQLRPDARVIVFVGRLERPKGVQVLLEAVALLRRTYPTVVLVVVGDGGFKAKLVTRAEQLGLGDAVRFLGRRRREEIANVLRASDVFASASEREAISMALLESQAVGIPAVVAGIGGAGALIRDGWNGFLLEERAAVAIADKIARVFDVGQAWSDRCVAASSPFDAKRIGRRVLDELATAAGMREPGSTTNSWALTG